MTAFITVSDVKAQLNISDSNSDAELSDYVDAACDEVEQWVGPMLPLTVTGEFVDLMGRTIYNELTTAGTRAFVLRHRPVQSIQAVSSAIISGVTYDPGDFIIDTATGIVRRKDGGTIFGPLTVDYTAGYVTPGGTAPAWARLAAKIIAQHLWRTQRAAVAAPSQMGDVTAVVPGFGFAVPNMAAELMESHRLVPAVG